MELKNFSRRDFVKTSLSALTLTSIPGHEVFGQTVGSRLEWQSFRAGPNYASFVNAIRAMRANTNANDPRSWNYWVTVHRLNCRHSISHFLAWHRGLLYYFERQLRIMSGNTALTLPYWNYYANTTIPVEFRTPANISNPLWLTGRNPRTNVDPLLSEPRWAFSSTSFQRGAPPAPSFEAVLEDVPHGRVHSLIGGMMGRLDMSPTDPIFWIHHCEIDRLWHAWVLAGNGMPAATDTYWSGTHIYRNDINPALTLPRYRTYHPGRLNVSYRDTRVPTRPGQTAGGQLPAAAPGGGDRRPPVRSLPPSPSRLTGEKRLALGGARELVLDENSVSVSVPVQGRDRESLQSVLEQTKAPPFGRAPSRQPYTSAQVVLDNVRMTPLGENGGYSYRVYLNLPETPVDPIAAEHYILGSFGSFEISTALHHQREGRLVFPATQALADMAPEKLRELIVSFVHVGGEKAPRGPVVVIGEVRLELSPDPVE